MSKTEMLLQFGIILIPSVAFFASAWYLITKWAEIQTEKHKLSVINKPEAIEKKESVSELKRHFFPLQVDAYQRLVLLCERIAPNNIVMRMNNPVLPARVFQQQLLESIRDEFEHNLAQQIFVSAEGWNLVRHSKEEVLKVINMAATQLAPDATATDLSKSIFEITAQLELQPTDKAIHHLKAELRGLVAS